MVVSHKDVKIFAHVHGSMSDKVCMHSVHGENKKCFAEVAHVNINILLCNPELKECKNSGRKCFEHLHLSRGNYLKKSYRAKPTLG